jgi:hypothetical protein
MLVNLTPHNIDIFLPDETHRVIPPTGDIARVTQTFTSAGSIEGIPVVRTQLGDVFNLPDTEPGVYYIVSRMVIQALPQRKDLVAPGQLIRDDDGRPIGVRELIRNPRRNPIKDPFFGPLVGDSLDVEIGPVGGTIEHRQGRRARRRRTLEEPPRFVVTGDVWDDEYPEGATLTYWAWTRREADEIAAQLPWENASWIVVTNLGDISAKKRSRYLRLWYKHLARHGADAGHRLLTT